MKKTITIAGLLCFSLAASKKPDTANLITAPAPVATATARSVRMADTDVEIIQARIRHNTMLVFPDGENVTVAGGGDVDKGRWIMESPSKTRQMNVFNIKPARSGADAETDLNIITSANHSYSFRLIACDRCASDVKVFVSHKDPKPEPGIVVSVDPHLAEIAQLTSSLESSREEARRETELAKQAKSEASERIEKETTEFRQAYPLSLRSDYAYKPRNKPPFHLLAIWSDETHTYIQMAGELTSIYTYMDGQPALAEFSYMRGSDPGRGTYVVDSVLRNGYLQLGKKTKLRFERIAK